jgi:cytidylate kinase
MSHRVIAIDGPAASGKSSVARALAQRLGFAYVNSGAMYRAVTWYIMQRGVDPRDSALVAAVAERSKIACLLSGAESQIRIDDHDPAAHLQDEPVNQAVSIVSSVPRVREILVGQMRSFANERDLVMEGRDIGSIVFPHTPFKFYIDASPEVRLQRRAAQGFVDEIGERDRADSSRATAPLVVARDAEVIDTSALSIDGVVDEIVRRLTSQGFR